VLPLDARSSRGACRVAVAEFTGSVVHTHDVVVAHARGVTVAFAGRVVPHAFPVASQPWHRRCHGGRANLVDFADVSITKVAIAEADQCSNTERRWAIGEAEYPGNSKDSDGRFGAYREGASW